jgi:hypothetical protein
MNKNAPLFARKKKMTRRQINKIIKSWYNSTCNTNIQVIVYNDNGLVKTIFEFGRNMFISDGRQSAHLKRLLGQITGTFDITEVPSEFSSDTFNPSIKIYGEKLEGK